MMNSYGSPKVFSIESEHAIIVKQLNKAIVMSPTLGLLHLN